MRRSQGREMLCTVRYSCLLAVSKSQNQRKLLIFNNNKKIINLKLSQSNQSVYLGPTGGQDTYIPCSTLTKDNNCFQPPSLHC